MAAEFHKDEEREEVQHDVNLFAYVVQRLKTPYWQTNWGREMGPRAIKALETIVQNEQALLDREK